jgi:ribosomal protein S18 acetylase RimI-like enzyme
MAFLRLNPIVTSGGNWPNSLRMTAFKILIDANIVIGLEDNHEVDVALTELVRRCSAHGVRLFVDGAVDDDIRRDSDLARRAVTLSKLARFERLRGITYPSDSDLARAYGTISSPNDRSDTRLLFSLERKAADFLITRDARLQKRARRSGLGGSVLSVEDAILWLRQTFEPTAVELPYVVEREAYAIDKTDPLFDSLRAEYMGFDEWFDERCAKLHRKCWVVVVGDVMAGIVIRKDETRTEAAITSPGRKILKLCTFKMRSEFRGEKFGEQLLKQSLWFAQTNGYDVVYLTAFADKDDLIHLLQSYGFVKTRRQENGELVFEKVMRKGPLLVYEQTDILAFDRACYPRFYDGERVAKYCVPIQGAYHEKLFPEISFRKPLPLFAGAEFARERTATAQQERTPGNTIRKVYLCRAQAKNLKPGDLLLFYLSKDERLEASQSMTSIGIVERLRETTTADELIRMTAKRSVFSAAELSERVGQSERPMKVIDFLLAGHISPTIGLDLLLGHRVFKGGPPQSIARIDEERYRRLRPLLKLGFDL